MVHKKNFVLVLIYQLVKLVKQQFVHSDQLLNQQQLYHQVHHQQQQNHQPNLELEKKLQKHFLYHYLFLYLLYCQFFVYLLQFIYIIIMDNVLNNFYVGNVQMIHQHYHQQIFLHQCLIIIFQVKLYKIKKQYHHHYQFQYHHQEQKDCQLMLKRYHRMNQVL